MRKKQMAKVVKLIRLISGEELISEVVADQTPKLLLSSDSGGNSAEINTDRGSVVLKNPYIVVTQQQGEQLKMGMAPWVVYRDKDALVTIRETAIIFVGDADDRLVAQYTQATSPIALPATGLVLPPGLR
jgi:hypothetical protein